MKPADRIIVALDYPAAEPAVRLVETLGDRVGAYKVGLELIHSAGFGVFERLRDAGAARLFYDAKLHDIPNTVGRSVAAIVRHRVWMTNLHAAGGTRMMEAGARAARETSAMLGVPKPLIMAVTLLTSISPLELASELRVDLSATPYVTHMALLARNSGCDGVICSPHEIAAVRSACGRGFLIVTPGVRPAWSPREDQRRVLTPREAVELGADYIVVGRPITAAEDPPEAVRRITEEIAETM